METQVGLGVIFQDGLGETVCHLKGGGLIFRHSTVQHLDVIEPVVVHVLYREKE